ncbi:MAG: STAS domain-containing protein [Bacteroidetes bacterium]|nr:STAS domain-containing protein [Bacteroidota bacterium]
MSFQVNKNEKYTIIRLKTEKLDTTVAPSLKSELVILNADGVKHIIIDLSAVRYCDSSGLSSILVANRLCKNANGAFVLMGLQEPVEKLIAISQLDSILNIAKSEQESIDMLFAQLAKNSGAEEG